MPARMQALATVTGLLALLILAVVDADGAFSPSIATWFLFQTLGAIAGGFAIRIYSQHHQQIPATTPLLVALGVSSLIWEPINRSLLAGGRPMEMIIMHGLGAVVWGLAVLSVWKKHQSACILMSLFLATFGLSAAHQLTVQVLAGIYAIAVVTWLTATYWESLRGRLRPQTRWSYQRWVILGLTAVVVVFIFSNASQSELLTAWQGFLPSSGGQGGADPFARNGVGNGESLVAGSKNIQSFGPIEDAPMLTDDKPSLYDVFDDTYDEPVKPTNHDRAIALMPEKNAPRPDHLHTQTQKASREFSTLRKSNSQKRNDVKSISSDALFYVSGRTPLHLRQELFDTFDGVNWLKEKSASHIEPLEMVKVNDQDWLNLKDLSETWSFLGPPQTHAIKVVRLDTNVIPAPLYVHGVHIADVGQADIFQVDDDGLIRMNRSTLPDLVPIHLASRAVDQKELLKESSILTNNQFLEVPEGLKPELKRIATEWTKGQPHGWPQIQAIIQQLQTSYRHDRQFKESVGSTSPILSFLNESKRGPDYQFATAAALLLRSLGYPTRVVSGFYARPDRYDVKSRHTPVMPEDVHFWAEVRLGAPVWITLEPTPGYTVLSPPLGVIGSITQFVVEVMAWANQHRLPLGLSMGILAMLLTFPGQFLDLFNTLCWRFHLRKRSAGWGWQIVRRRLANTGCQLSPGMTPYRILHQFSQDVPQCTAENVAEFVRILNWEAFSDSNRIKLPNEDLDCCDQFVTSMTSQRCRYFSRSFATSQSGRKKSNSTRDSGTRPSTLSSTGNSELNSVSI